jgi:hypothetical protein
MTRFWELVRSIWVGWIDQAEALRRLRALEKDTE